MSEEEEPVDEDAPAFAALELDAETRTFTLQLRGDAAMLLFLLGDRSPHGVVATLHQEAQFDTIIANYND